MGMVPDFPMSHLMDYRTWTWYVERWGWIGEVFGGGHGQEDYRGSLGEWLRKEKKA